MKTTSKILLAAIALCIINSSSVFARGGGDNGRFSIGVEAGFPMGDFGTGFKTGFGGTLRYEHPVGDNLALMLTTGIIAFGAKDNTIANYSGPSSATAPIQVGAKYYFQEQQSGFYGQAELGVHIFVLASQTVGTETVKASSSTGFSYAPAVGYALDNWDFSVRYQLFSYAPTDLISGSTSSSVTWSYLGLRAAFVFGSR